MYCGELLCVGGACVNVNVRILYVNVKGCVVIAKHILYLIF